MANRDSHTRAGQIAVRTYGEGPSLLFLHGLAASGVSWRLVAERIPGYRCVAPDLLGFGSSAKPDVLYDLATHCDALDALVKEHRPRAIVGHSMGAIIGALTMRSRLLGRVSCTLMCHLRPVLRPALPLFARDLPADVVKAGLDHSWQSISRSLERVVSAGLVPPLMDQVGDRVTVLHGTNDETVPISQVAGLRDSCVEFFPVEVGHLLPLHRPEAVADAVLGRLTQDQQT